MGKFSTIPELKSALEAGIAAAVDPGVQVQRGLIDPPALEMVEIFEARITERTYRALKPQPHGIRETYEVTIRVTAMSSAQITLAAAEDRSWAICDDIDTACRADIGWGTLLEWSKLERADQRFWRWDQFRGSVILITLTAQATFD